VPTRTAPLEDVTRCFSAFTHHTPHRAPHRRAARSSLMGSAAAPTAARGDALAAPPASASGTFRLALPSVSVARADGAPEDDFRTWALTAVVTRGVANPRLWYAPSDGADALLAATSVRLPRDRERSGKCFFNSARSRRTARHFPRRMIEERCGVWRFELQTRLILAGLACCCIVVGRAAVTPRAILLAPSRAHDASSLHQPPHTRKRARANR
jgi:hypothetical protein